MKLLAVLLTLLMSSYTFSVECRGDIEIPNSVYKSSVYLSFDEIKEGQFITLGAPILSDLTMSMAFKIISVQFLPSAAGYLVREVIATSTNTGSGTVMIFNHVMNSSDDEVLISNFKGFEGKRAYGPSELSCE